MPSDIRTHKLTIVCAMLFVLVLGNPWQAAAQRSGFGAVTGAAMVDCQDNAELGVGIIRAGQDWRDLQSSPYQTIDWSYQDSVFDCFINQGIDIFWTLAYAPVAAGGDHDGHNLPDYGAWQNFVWQALTHYHPRYGNRITFGIWNEPDGTFLRGCPSYYNDKGQCWGAQLWAPAVAIRNQYAPGARLAGPEMGTYDSRFDSALGYFNAWAQPQDVITTHWYGFSPGLANWMNTVISKAGGRETWLTETGWTNTCHPQLQADAINHIATTFVQRSNPAWTKIFIYRSARLWDCSSLRLGDGTKTFAFNTYKSYIPGAPSGGGFTTMTPGQTLYPGQALYSPNGRFQFIYQTDGNLVLYDNGAAAWAINCWPECRNVGVPGRATMQTDGNFVVYDAYNSPVFHTWTFGHDGSYLTIGDDGSLAVRSPGGSILWQR